MPILKELFLWLYDIFLDIIGFCANSLLKIMSTDLTYFETNVPAVKTMYSIFIAVGWALLLGNMVFQAMKSMFTGLGFEGENPAILLARSGIFGFLLIFSRQICDIGMGISKKVIDLLGIPTQINLKLPEEDFFSGFDSSWMLVIIIGLILGIQLVKLFLEIGERYVIVAILTLFAPIGFAMGGSKSTKDIFAGYIRMYASMLLMMVMNVVFLKLILSAMSVMPSGVMILPWGVLVVGLARAARKIDNLIGKIGLNPATTGDPLTRGGIGMATMMAAKMAVSSVSRSGHHLQSSSRSSSSVSSSGGFRSNPKKPYGASESMGRFNPTQNNMAPGQPNTDRFGIGVQTANTTMQNQQSSRFGSASYVQGGSLHAPQNTAVQANSNIGGINSTGFHHVGFHTVNGGSPINQQITQSGQGGGASPGGQRVSAGQQAVSAQTGKNQASSAPNIRQNPKSQPPAPTTARFGQAVPKKSQTGNALHSNGSQSKPSAFGSMKMSPNFRKPPILNMAKTVSKEKTAEIQQDASSGLSSEQPERNEQTNE